jgi:hypothetical protein
MPLATVIKSIRKLFGGSTNFNEGIRVVVNTEKLEQRVAVVESGVLEEYTIERTGTLHIVGSIYKGRVRNIEQGLKAMFVDIGLEKNAFPISGTPSPPPTTRRRRASATTSSTLTGAEKPSPRKRKSPPRTSPASIR